MLNRTDLLHPGRITWWLFRAVYREIYCFPEAALRIRWGTEFRSGCSCSQLRGCLKGQRGCTRRLLAALKDTPQHKVWVRPSWFCTGSISHLPALMYQIWRGKDPLVQPASHLHRREHTWPHDAARESALSVAAEGVFKLWMVFQWKTEPIKLSHLFPCWVIWFHIISLISTEGFNAFALAYWDCRFLMVGMAHGFHAWDEKESGALLKHALPLPDI